MLLPANSINALHIRQKMIVKLHVVYLILSRINFINKRFSLGSINNQFAKVFSITISVGHGVSLSRSGTPQSLTVITDRVTIYC
jgi:hypothetical protein